MVASDVRGRGPAKALRCKQRESVPAALSRREPRHAKMVFPEKSYSAMPKEYSRIACSIGKALGERQRAITREPLPQHLTELLSRLSENEKTEQADQKKVEPRGSRS